MAKLTKAEALRVTQERVLREIEEAISKGENPKNLTCTLRESKDGKLIVTYDY